MKKIDWSKPVRHVIEGLAATYTFVAMDGDKAIVRVNNTSYGAFDEYGISVVNRSCILENVPVTHDRWVMAWRNQAGNVSSATLKRKPTEDDMRFINVIAVKKVTITEGEGLD